MATLQDILTSFYNYVMVEHNGELRGFQVDDFIEKEGKKFIGATVENSFKSKGNWEFERSSGYAGYRCQTCMKWVYSHEVQKCSCDL